MKTILGMLHSGCSFLSSPVACSITSKAELYTVFRNCKATNMNACSRYLTQCATRCTFLYSQLAAPFYDHSSLTYKGGGGAAAMKT